MQISAHSATQLSQNLAWINPTTDAYSGSELITQQPVKPGSSSHLMIISGDVSHIETLQSHAAADTEVVVLDASQDGVTQISELLAHRRQLASVHIVSHGSQGSLHLGDSRLSLQTIGQYQQQIMSWADAFSEAGDLFLYGCDVAAGVGQAFVQQLSQLTGTDVVASVDATGSEQLGGNWQLEYAVGKIDGGLGFRPELLAAYSAVLAGDGLRGEYYDNQNFTNLQVTRVDPTVNFIWNGITPDPLIAFNSYSVRWTGQVQPLYSETYTFYTVSDDGIRLTVNGQTIINNFTDHAPTEDRGTITLVAGQRYDIQIDYFQGGGGSTAQLLWSSARQSKQVIPQSQLYSSRDSGGSGGGGGGGGTGSTIALANGSYTVNEGDGTASVVVVRTGSTTGSSTVQYSTTAGTATAGADYTTTSGTLTFGVGETSKTILIPIVNDTAVESNETFTLALSAATGATLGTVQSATVTIVDNDSPPPVGGGTGTGLRGEYYDNQNFTNLRVTRVDPTVNFTWNGITPDPLIALNTFSVRWTGQVEPLYSETYTFYTVSDDGVRLTVNGQTIINNFTDHAPTEDRGTITLVAGQRYDIQIDYFQGGGGATAQLLWSSARQSKQVIPQSQLYNSGGGGGGTGSTIALANGSYTVNEGDGTASVVVVRTGSTTGSSTVQYSTTAGTATAGADYTTTSGTLTFGVGETSKTILIPIVNDTAVESNETFTLALSAATGATLGTVQSATVTIVDNDSPPPVGGGTGTGLRGEYYDNQNFTNLRVTRVDPTVNFTWNGITPDPLIALNTFSVRWTGQVEPLYSETYTFYTVSDDGVRLTVNGQTIINNFTDHAPTEDRGTITLVAGQRYDIQVDYYQGGGGATAQLLWSSLRQTKQVIPQSQLYNSGSSDVTPPNAVLGGLSAPVLGAVNYEFTVTYTDNGTVSLATLDGQDIAVTGPNSFNPAVTLVGVNTPGSGSSRTATYRFTAPGGAWDASDAGVYTMALRANQVSDASGNFALARTLGTLTVDFTSSTPILINGSDRADTLIAPDGRNYLLNGGAGNDTIIGGAGNDILVGGTGNDNLNGGGGNNTVSYADASNGVTVNLTTGIANRIARILPVGDSITLGISEGISVTPEPLRSQIAGGYRTVLWQNFQRDGVTIDFVGSQVNGPDNLGDKNHEGYGGKRIAFVNDNVLTFLANAKPDVVLLMIGTNDTFVIFLPDGSYVETPLNQMVGGLSAVIDKITAFSPDLTLFVASIPPILFNADERLDPAGQARQKQLGINYNNEMPTLISQKQAAGAKVEFVDMRSLTEADIVPQGSSGVHPTQSGYTKIGNLWYTALNSKIGIEQGTYKVDRDTLVNLQNVIGSTFNDTLVGNLQSNVITGGLGADRLTGGGGLDIYVYRSITEGNDTITDFGSDDRFRISANGFGAGLTAGVGLSLTAATTGMLVNSNVATSNVATFLYSNGLLRFDADGTGSGQAVNVATLLNGPATLDLSQFEIIA
jgi:Ca2+-binding RTX toxin-like protein